MATTTTTKSAKSAKPVAVPPPALSEALAAALKATRDAVKVYDRKMTARDKATLAALTAKVDVARHVITLMTFQETWASRGPKAGKPSVSIIAEMLGYPRQSFTPLYKGAEALAEHYATLSEDDVKAIMAGATPTERELDLVSVGLASEAEGSRAHRDKTKEEATGRTAETEGDTAGETDGETDGATPAAKSEPVIPTYDAVVSATLALQAIINGYCKDAGFSAVQAENLQATLAEMAATIDSHRVDGGDA